MWLMKTLLTSRCINQRGAGQGCITFNLSWPVWGKAFLGEETIDAVIESMGAFEKHSVAYLSDKDVAR